MTSKGTMDSHRKNAVIVGVLYIIGTVTGVLSLVFSEPIRSAQDPLVHISTNGNQLIMSALFLLIMGLALALVPVVMFPILKKFNEALALGYVVFRGGLEAVAYIATTIGWLLLVPLSQTYVKAGAPNSSDIRAWGNLLLKGDEVGSVLTIVFCLGALMFYYVLYQSKLIPRWLSAWGLICAIPYLASGLLAMFAVTESLSTLHSILELPLAVQEMVMALWLIFKGFNPSVISSKVGKVDRAMGVRPATV